MNNEIAALPQSVNVVPMLYRTAEPTPETLPFTVRVARNEPDLRKAVAVRYAAYARHVPEFAQTLRDPEPMDSIDGVAVLLAESKLDGAPLGTMRIQSNRYQPLCLEKSVSLPRKFSCSPLAEATRLGITEDRVGRVVKTALFKAFYQYCVHHGVEWMVITARPPIDRQYQRLLFEDVYGTEEYIPIAHVGNLPHRIMTLNVRTAQQRWEEAEHPLCGYMLDTHHADINIHN